MLKIITVPQDSLRYGAVKVMVEAGAIPQCQLHIITRAFSISYNYTYWLVPSEEGVWAVLQLFEPLSRVFTMIDIANEIAKGSREGFLRWPGANFTWNIIEKPIPGFPTTAQIAHALGIRRDPDHHALNYGGDPTDTGDSLVKPGDGEPHGPISAPTTGDDGA